MDAATTRVRVTRSRARDHIEDIRFSAGGVEGWVPAVILSEVPAG